MADEKKDVPSEEGAAPPSDRQREPMYYYEEPEVPEVLPDDSWPTEKLVSAAKTDRNMLVRANAIAVLDQRGGPEVLEVLIQALKDQEYIVRSSAMVKLAARGKDILDRMIQALEDPDEGIRSGAAWVLGEIKDEKAIKPLEKAAADENIMVRVQAKASLMALGVLKPGKKTA